MSRKEFHGKLPPEGIRMLELPRLPAGVVDGFKALADLTATVSDVMDELGLVGVISEVVKVSEDPEAKRTFAAQGYILVGSTPQEFSKTIVDEIELHRRLVAQMGYTPQ